MSLAPIALFVYNRPEHTKKTISALKNNELAKDSDLIIFSDAAKNESGVAAVNELRNYLKTISGFKSVKIIERSENFGLAKSIISGVTEVVNQYGKIIVLEDDLITSPYFLDYMNEALDLYEIEDRVISIHGYVHPVKAELPETFFLRGADCWGWATWKRGWDLFESDGQKLLNELKEKKLINSFDWNGAYPYSQMLKSQIIGLNNSWAIRWHASAFVNNKLTLYPGKSLVVNAGFDNSGTHTGSYSAKLLAGNMTDNKIKVGKIAIEEDCSSLKKIKNHYNYSILKIMTTLMKFRFYLNSVKMFLSR